MSMLKTGQELITGKMHTFELTLPFDAGAFKSELYQLDVVEQETFDEMGHEVLTVRLPSDKLQQLLGQAGLEPNDVLPTSKPNW